MAKQQPIEIFMPPNILKAKVGSAGAVSGFDIGAIRRGEAAMDALKSEFGGWLASDVTRLLESRDKYAAAPTTEHRGDLFRAAHDLKGQADTYGYPLIARMAASLTKLLDEIGSKSVPFGLADAHVAAIRIVFRDKITAAGDPTASALASELEARVKEELAA
ncbi:MAG TPA: Hpt domain-containing protein [Rhizomicrobium sp.]|nr:Hpt domain-containing protein [Rhizomicrobium sp.]